MDRNTVATRIPAIATERNLEVLADYPAYKVVRMPTWFVCKHGTEFVIPFMSRSHGILWHFFKVGTVIGYAVEKGDDPLASLAQSKERGHKLHWANAQAVCIDNMKHEKKTAFAVDFGDIITVEGIRFILARASNDNVTLVPVS